MRLRRRPGLPPYPADAPSRLGLPGHREVGNGAGRHHGRPRARPARRLGQGLVRCAGMPAEAPTIAMVLKSMGCATGQFGKNHLGDLNKFLPTVHGFDEFFGYLYHLDAMWTRTGIRFPWTKSTSTSTGRATSSTALPPKRTIRL